MYFFVVNFAYLSETFVEISYFFLKIGVFKSKKEGKDQESIQSSTTPRCSDPRYI